MLKSGEKNLIMRRVNGTKRVHLQTDPQIQLSWCIYLLRYNRCGNSVSIRRYCANLLPWRKECWGMWVEQAKRLRKSERTISNSRNNGYVSLLNGELRDYFLNVKCLIRYWKQKCLWNYRSEIIIMFETLYFTRISAANSRGDSILWWEQSNFLLRGGVEMSNNGLNTCSHTVSKSSACYRDSSS